MVLRQIPSKLLTFDQIGIPALPRRFRACVHQSLFVFVIILDRVFDGDDVRFFAFLVG